MAMRGIKNVPSSRVCGGGNTGTKGCKAVTSCGESERRVMKSAEDSATVKETE